MLLQVTPKDGDPYVVETNLGTIIAWERKYKRPASDFAQAMAMEWVCFMAYQAAKDSGITVPAVFDDFIRRTQNVEVVEPDTANPTDPVPTAESL